MLSLNETTAAKRNLNSHIGIEIRTHNVSVGSIHRMLF